MTANKENDIILVPTDFTEAADCAVEHAVSIAKITKDEVKLFHVINRETKSKLKKEHQSIDYIDAKLKEQAESIMSKHDVKASFVTKEGSIFSAIGEVAEETKAKLLVMGTHGVVGIQKVVGAYALKVVMSTSVPTIIVQKKSPKKDGYKKIILPIDGSKETKQKIIHAISIAKYFTSEIHIIAEHNSDSYIKNDIKLNGAFAKNVCNKNGVKFVYEESENEGFTKATMSYATKIDADMIVIMTQQDKKNVSEYFLGPYEEQVINNEDQIPVMCVNPNDDLFIIRSIITGD